MRMQDSKIVLAGNFYLFIYLFYTAGIPYID